MTHTPHASGLFYDSVELGILLHDCTHRVKLLGRGGLAPLASFFVGEPRRRLVKSALFPIELGKPVFATAASCAAASSSAGIGFGAKSAIVAG